MLAEIIEKEIVESFVTEVDMSKVINKMAIEFNQKPEGKGIGMFISLVWKDLIEEEIYTIVKKYKNPTINFNTLKILCAEKCRKFLNI